MIPSRKQCVLFFDKFNLPSQKRIHVEEVTKLAMYFARKLLQKNIAVNVELIEASALLHDIDKNIPKKEGERHPDTAVRILNELGFSEVADVVKKHSLHCVLDSELAPKTWEEKIVYLADKMTKYEIIGVDHRFKLWYKEDLPQEATVILDASFAKVKALEQEFYRTLNIDFTTVKKDLLTV